MTGGSRKIGLSLTGASPITIPDAFAKVNLAPNPFGVIVQINSGILLTLDWYGSPVPKAGKQPQRLFDKKKVEPFAWANCARTCSDWLALTELYGEKLVPLRRATLPWKKGYPAWRITILAETNFHVNGSPSLVRKMKKSWSAQGSKGTSFLPINGA